jgi:hypothetical protein
MAVHPSTQADVLADAQAVIDAHFDDNGICRGCLVSWARLAPHPCPQRQWATSVMASLTPDTHRDSSTSGPRNA